MNGCLDKLALCTRLESGLKRLIQRLNPHLRKHTRIYLLAKKIFALNPKLYARIKSTAIRYGLTRIRGEADMYYAANGLSGKPKKVIILKDDYGLDQRAWSNFREKLLSNCLKGYDTMLGSDNKGTMWICFVADTGINSNDWGDLLKTAQKIKDKSQMPMHFVVMGKIQGGKTNDFKSPHFGFVEDINIFSKMLGDNDIVFFANPGDSIDERLPLFINLNDGFNKDFIIFDMYFIENSRAYPILLHGVDPVHARYCDYFHSRFCLRGRVFHRMMPQLKNFTIRDLALACLKSEADMTCLHIPLPLIRINVDHSLITKMRDSVKSRRSTNEFKKNNISVVICTKDNADLLQRLISQIQREPAIKEIIIVSNNSKTAEMKMLLKQMNGGSFIRVMHYEKPFNFSEQNNLAAGCATGENIFFLNDDTCPVSEGWLEFLIESIGDGNQIAGPLLLYPNQTVQHGGMFLGFNNVAGHIMRHSTIPDKSVSFGLYAPRKVSCLTGAALLVPRKIFEDLNGFDPLLPTLAQDVDFCLRAIGSGVDLIFDPRAILLHFESISLKPTLKKEPARRAREREFDYFIKKWGAPKDNWLNPNIDVSDESMRSIICSSAIHY
jgi:GT2 family glycosyltransferase